MSWRRPLAVLELLHFRLLDERRDVIFVVVFNSEAEHSDNEIALGGEHCLDFEGVAAFQL